MLTEIAILSIIIVFASFTETLSGFGKTIISVTFGSHFFPVEMLLAVIVPINLVLSGYVVSKNVKHINTELLLKKIIPFMLAGQVIGMIIFNFIQGDILKKIYAVFIILLSVYQLNLLLRKKEVKKAPNSFINLMIFLGGIIHGIYASGGPMVVYSLSNYEMTKESFRATLSSIWLFFNIILVVMYIFTSKITTNTLTYSIYLIPALIIGISIGDYAHKKIKEESFKIFIYSVLILAGLIIIIPSFLKA